MYLSAGSNKVFEDTKKMGDLGTGWQQGCIKVVTSWGGGETPMLRDVVFPNAFEIGGGAWGMLNKPQRPIDSKNIRLKDRVILARSSGPHDNGLTLMRDIRSQRLQELGYQTIIPGANETFGEALMKPTILYGPLVRGLLSKGCEIHSALNITGHGLAKLARATAPFHYVVEKLPEPQPVFGFIAKHSGLPKEKLYSKLNMGTGYALIVPESDASDTIELGTALGYDLLDAGRVEKSPDGQKRVFLPNGIIFTGKHVAVRH